MSSRANSKLYTCGRMHKPRKHKLPLHVQSARSNAVISAVTRLMKEELGEVACTRWCSRLNTELGCETFGCEPRVEEGGSSGDGEGEADGWLAGAALPVPRAWVPSKPKIAMALLDQLARVSESTEGGDHKVSVGSDGLIIVKVLARRVIELMREDKGSEWLRACGELRDAQLEDPTKLSQVLSRVAFDLLVYVHARAVKFQRDDGDVVEGAVLELHSSDQTLVGKGMRGCGVVFCEAGLGLFARAVTCVRDELERSLTDTTV